jgi:integrase
MANYEFKSSWADCLLSYCNKKEASGYSSYRKNGSSWSVLRHIDKFCIENKITEIALNKTQSIEFSKRWSNESESSYRLRMIITNGFLKDLRLLDYPVFIPVVRLKNEQSFLPHIYTSEEIENYFKAIDLYEYNNRKDAMVYPLMFRTMYSNALRISEVTGILKQDVDLTNGIIKIRNPKNSQERYAFIQDALLSMWNIYSSLYFEKIENNQPVFFSKSKESLPETYIHRFHIEFLNNAGITYQGDSRGPRIHDWRHTAAVNACKKLIDSGKDMYTALPILSSWLGHQSLASTEYYLRLTQMIFPEINKKIGDSFSSLQDFWEKPDEIE